MNESRRDLSREIKIKALNRLCHPPQGTIAQLQLVEN
jgi:hypothetical protein